MYLGLDTSTTSTGFCLKDKKLEVVVHKLIRPDGVLADRLYELFKTLIRLIKKHKIKFAAIEGYSFGFIGRIKKVQSASIYQTAEAAGIAKLAMVHCRLPFLIVQPPSLKKFATGSGGGKKELIVKCYEEETGLRAKTDDVADSYYLASIAHAFDLWPKGKKLDPKKLQVILDMKRVDKEGREKKNIWPPAL